VPGAHTREVLAGLGYGAADIDALAEAGVIEVTK
jgi:crotonobetainyl-CoA:carnitine CoA-transferase CaiB-like acyl-CoA transferase